MSEMNGASRYAPAEGLELTTVPDGTMIYQASRERVHYLNPTATIVFQLCEEGKTVAEIEQFIADSFDLAEAPTESVQTCVKSLIDEGLVTSR